MASAGASLFLESEHVKRLRICFPTWPSHAAFWSGGPKGVGAGARKLKGSGDAGARLELAARVPAGDRYLFDPVGRASTHQKVKAMRKMGKLISLTIALSLIAGCMASVPVKKVPDQPVPDLRSEDSKPIQFKRIVVKLNRGARIGTLNGGVLCVPYSALTWRGGRLSIASEELDDVFREELEKHNFKVVGDPDALFDDPSAWRAEILVAGLVRDLKVNVCYPYSGFGDFSRAKAEAYIRVEWQVYSQLDRAVVHKVATEGYGRVADPVAGGDEMAVFNAFAHAVRQLLSDGRFREIVTGQGVSVHEAAYKRRSTIRLIRATAKPAGRQREHWHTAVFTVISPKGHGSGFAISDNLVLTNYHVVKEADTVVIKATGGVQFKGKVLARDSGRDVAVIQTDALLPRYFAIARRMPSVGQEVYAIGTPLSEELQATVTRGVLSAVRHRDGRRFLQSDVTILPGNSGGPLLTSDGRVIGVAVAGMQVHGAPVGINYFIPIKDALDALGIYAWDSAP